MLYKAQLIGNYMQINQVNNTQPNFGTIKFAFGVDNVLVRLPQKDLSNFVKKAKRQNKNSFVDITLFSKDDKTLSARIEDKRHYINGPFYQVNLQKRWGFFESTMGFIERCCKTADKRAQKIREALEKQKLLRDLDK